MFKKLLFAPNYSFDLDEVKSRVTLEKDNPIELVINGEKYIVGELWAALVAHYEVNLKFDECKFISFKHSDSKVINNRAGFIMTISPPKHTHDGFYVIPGYVKYEINVHGVVRYRRTSNVLSETINPYGYPTVTLFDPDKRMYRAVAIHRLKALTFIPNDSYTNKPFVNHLDGDKMNHNLDNLEWSSGLENNIHAIVNNLRTDNQRCKVRDVETGQITEYPSLSEACRALGYSAKQAITTNYNGQYIPKLLRNRYEIKLVSDSSDWYHTSSWHARPISEGPFEVLNVVTGEVTECRTLSECARFTGIAPKAIKSRIDQRIMRSMNGFAFRFKTSEEWPKDIQERLYTKKRQLKVTNVLTQETRIFESLNKASIETGIDKQTIRFRINTNRPHRDFIFEE